MTQGEFNIYKDLIKQLDKHEKTQDYRIILFNMNLLMVMENKPPITDTVENAIKKARAVN